MGFEEFQAVILGDEPAGLWLAKRLQQLDARRPAGTPAMRVAWVSFSDSPERIPIPRAAALPFGLTCQDGWVPEIVTPKRSLVWEESSLAALYSDWPTGCLGSDPIQSLLKPRSQQLASVRHLLRSHPELLSYASGLWKFFGRTSHLQPEMLMLGSLLATELAWWDAASEVPPEVTRIRLSPTTNPIDKVKVLRQEGIVVDFKDHGSIVSRNWILNLSVQRLTRLSSLDTSLMDLLGLNGEMRSGRALYPLRLKVESAGIPCAVRPLTIYFDTEDIPDIEGETWPFQVLPGTSADEKQLVLWVPGPRDPSLDTLLESFRTGMRRLNHLFPFLHRTLLGIEVPLEMESCFLEDERTRVIERLEESALELYDLTSFQTQTRNPWVSHLFPFLYCHLPYPLGPLCAARKLLEQIVGKKRLKEPPAAISAPPLEPSA